MNIVAVFFIGCWLSNCVVLIDLSEMVDSNIVGDNFQNLFLIVGILHHHSIHFLIFLHN